MSIRLGDQLISATTVSGSGISNLLDFKWADHVLNDISWVRSDTFTWHNGITYSDAYRHLKDDLESATEHVDWWASHITKAGALVDTDGVLSGFTGNTVYATIPNPETVTSSFEMVVKVHTPTSFASSNSIINCLTVYKGFIVGCTNAGVVYLYLSSNGTSWDIANSVKPGITLLPDTNYWMKLSWDGSQYVLSYSLDGEDYVDGTPIANTNPLRVDSIALGGTSRESYPWLSTIDLNESYIKVDGETVWEGCEYFTWYQAEDGHRLVLSDQEVRVVAMFNTTGVAWYYMIDTENQLFKLPRSKWAFVGLRDEVGKYVPESLPNITGKLRMSTSSTLFSGAFYQSASGGGQPWDGQGLGWREGTLDASRSSTAYQDGAPVQERATQMYLYFYIGTYSQSALAQTAGVTTEVLNQKLDVSKLQVVESLPSNPNPETWYAIAE